MPAVISSLCVGVLCGAPCIDVCIIDCIQGPISMNGEDVMQVRLRGERPEDGRVQLYVNPELCLDCGACEVECPANAIFEEQDLPDEYKSFITLNADFFKGR